MSPASRRVSQDTPKKTSSESTSDSPETVTPAGNVNTPKYAADSKPRVVTRPVAIEAMAPERVAPGQLRPMASAGTREEENSHQPKIPRNATKIGRAHD